MFGDWKFPIFIDFDTAVTLQTYNEILFGTAAAGVRLMISVSDQGPRNESVGKSLGITTTHHWSTHPFNSAWKVYYTYDFIHEYKNQRNNILDFKMRIYDTEVSKKDFEDLFKVCKGEFNDGQHLTNKMLNCRGPERQNVGLACNLLSEKTANLFRKHFADDEAKMVLADFIETIHRGE